MNSLVHTRIELKTKEEIAKIIKNNNFSSVSEFIKESIRKNIEYYRRQEVLNKHLASQPEKILTKNMKKESAKDAFSYDGDIFKDLGLR